MEIIFDINQIDETAKIIAASLTGISVAAFHGQMGAGKTTFITALCKELGVVSSIGSPTYSIINQYITTSGKIIYHMDWYRLRDEEEAIAAGVEDALYSGNLCLVEWPEKAEGLLPDDAVHINITLAAEGSRKLTISKKD